MSDKLLSVLETAERTSTSAAFWRKAISRGQIPIVKIGRLTRIRESDLEAWIRLGLQPARRRVA